MIWLLLRFSLPRASAFDTRRNAAAAAADDDDDIPRNIFWLKKVKKILLHTNAAATLNIVTLPRPLPITIS